MAQLTLTPSKQASKAVSRSKSEQGKESCDSREKKERSTDLRLEDWLASQLGANSKAAHLSCALWPSCMGDVERMGHAKR